MAIAAAKVTSGFVASSYGISCLKTTFIAATTVTVTATSSSVISTRALISLTAYSTCFLSVPSHLVVLHSD